MTYYSTFNETCDENPEAYVHDNIARFYNKNSKTLSDTCPDKEWQVCLVGLFCLPCWLVGCSVVFCTQPSPDELTVLSLMIDSLSTAAKKTTTLQVSAENAIRTIENHLLNPAIKQTRFRLMALRADVASQHNIQLQPIVHEQRETARLLG